MKKLVTLILFLFSLNANAQLKYPPSKMVDSVDIYFGNTYRDPYRWLENMKDTTVVSWFKQQADYSTTILNKISGRDELIAEWKKLDKLQPTRFNGRLVQNGKIFYRKTLPGQAIGKLYYRQGITGKETLLFDPSTYIKGKKLTIESFMPSYDGSRLAIAYSQQGAEVATVKIMDVESGQLLKDELFPVGEIQGWTFDNNALLYLALNTADNMDTQGFLNTKTKLHQIGTAAISDKDYFSNASYPALKIASKSIPYVGLSEEEKNYVFAGEYTVEAEYKMYYSPIAQFGSGNIAWQPFCTPDDQLVRSMEFANGKVYAISHKDAPNYRLIATSIAQPDWSHPDIIAAEKKDMTLEAMTRCKDFLLLTYSDGINTRLFKYSLVTQLTTEIKLPYTGLIRVFCLDKKKNDCTLSITSWNKPVTEFDFNPAEAAFSPGFFNKPPFYPEAYRNLEVKEVTVKAHDGEMIPLSIIFKKGTKLDGNNVCLLEGYGAYGISISPVFSPRTNSLAVKGVVIAMAHVRGGSEKGETWYKGGYKTTKPNTWKDFNSCAEYLISNGYTKPAKLAGSGTSAGGILITRAITARPDLYAAAICNVGVTNAMRTEFSSNGPPNIPEFGTVKDSLECKALYEMDGVQHVVTGTRYPALLCVAGWNDSRVVPWEPGKFAAALQNASISGKPVLMKVNYDNGHFTEDKNVTFANFADQYAFILWQCGHPDFQLKTSN
jgi:prolyl oligopeptidase